MQVGYFKMQGTGNKIIVVDQRKEGLPPPGATRVRELEREAGGLDFDQLMWVSRSDDPAHAASYRVFNADGSEVEQCGNGVRCVARILARESQLANAFTLSSPAGPVSVRIEGESISVSMGRPDFEPAHIPFVADRLLPAYSLQVGNEALEIRAVSMGNPHCVIQVENADAAPLEVLGPAIEHHARFPERTNVGFMEITDRRHVSLRVHERGVGETLACGTGACAAVVCGQRAGKLDERVIVRLPGGQVVVSWRGGDDPVWLTGNAELISEGTLHL